MGRREDLSTLVVIIVLAALAVLFLMSAGGVSVNPVNLEGRAHQAVEAHGFTNIQYQGLEFWACGTDSQGWNYSATNPEGVVVNLTACTENGILGINKSWWIVTR